MFRRGSQYCDGPSAVLEGSLGHQKGTLWGSLFYAADIGWKVGKDLNDGDDGDDGDDDQDDAAADDDYDCGDDDDDEGDDTRTSMMVS